MSAFARVVLFLLLAAGFGSVGAHAAPVLLTDADKELIGATGVNVGGVLYDVQFLDGLCSTLFSGCDANTDFQFQTEAAANQASQALLDTVFVNGDPAFQELQYATFPGLTFGCSSVFDTGDCLVVTPYAIVSLANVILHASYAINNAGTVSSGPFADIESLPDASTGSGSVVFAVWSLSATDGDGDPQAVPAPGALLLLAGGFGAVLAVRGRRRARG